jgi:photosystem II stability/assembly factor-like uncharacterized protein
MSNSRWRICLCLGAVVVATLLLGGLLIGASLAAPKGADEESETPALMIIEEMPGWQNAGLYGGFASLAAFDPIRDEIYLGAGAGYYKSTDGGSTWTRITNKSNGGALAVDPISGTVYLGYEQPEAILVSEDGGVTWNAVEEIPGGIRVFATDPQNGHVVFAGRGGYNPNYDGYVHRSLDGGQTWITTTVDPGHCIVSLAVDPLDQDCVWAVSSPCSSSPDYSAVYSSTDRGLSYSLVLTSSDIHEYYQTLFDPSGMLYVAGGDGVIVSDNRGITFTKTLTKNLWFDYQPMFLSQADGRVYVATFDGGGYHSDDGGQTWQSDGFSHLYGVNPLNPLHILAWSMIGVQRTTNGGVTWQNASTGVEGVAINEVVASSANPQVVYASTYNGIARSTDGGLNWDFSILDISAIGMAVDPTDSDRVYTGWAMPPKVYSSTNGGNTWASSVVTSTDGVIMSLAVDPNITTTIYVGISSLEANAAADTTWDGLYVSLDSGASWNLAGLQGKQVNTVVAVTETAGTIVYAGTGLARRGLAEGGIYRWRTGETGWTQLGPTDVAVMHIAVDPDAPEHLYVGVGSEHAALSEYGLYESHNAGDSWTKLTGFPDKSCRWITFDEREEGILYAAAEYDLMQSLDGGQTWTVYATYPHGRFETLDMLSSGRLLAGAEGGLYWRVVRVEATAGPLVSDSLAFTSTEGMTATIDIPAGAVTEDSLFLYTDITTAALPADILAYGGLSFNLNVYQSGAKVPDIDFVNPVTVTLQYTDTHLAGLPEENLALLIWNGSTWRNAACGGYARNPGENKLAVPICQAGQFALVLEPYRVYLPLTLRQY